MSDVTNTYFDTSYFCDAVRPFMANMCHSFEWGLQEKFGKKVQVHMDFCANDSVNAFSAQSDDEVYFVGINTGCVEQLHQRVQKVWRTSPMLVEGIALTRSTQQQKSRELALTIIATFASLHFLAAHELGHIAYGHVSLLKSLLNGRSAGVVLAEAAPSRPNVEGFAEVMQCMEVDADLYASNSLILAIANGVLGGMSVKDWLASPEDILTVATLGILTLFDLFCEQSTTIKNHRAKSHPLPIVRLWKFGLQIIELQHTDIKNKFKQSDMFSAAFDHLLAEGPALADVFPSMRLWAQFDMTAELKRLRELELRLARQLTAFTMIPVGSAIV